MLDAFFVRLRFSECRRNVLRAERFIERDWLVEVFNLLICLALEASTQTAMATI